MNAKAAYIPEFTELPEEVVNILIAVPIVFLIGVIVGVAYFIFCGRHQEEMKDKTFTFAESSGQKKEGYEQLVYVHIE